MKYLYYLTDKISVKAVTFLLIFQLDLKLKKLQLYIYILGFIKEQQFHKQKYEYLVFDYEPIYLSQHFLI